MPRLTKSINTRILLWLSLLLIVTISMVVYYSYTNTYDYAYEQSSRIVELEVKREKVYIEKEFTLLYESTHSFVVSIDEIRVADDIINKRDLVLSIAERIVKEHQNIAGINIVFEPNAFDNDDSSFINDEKYSSTGQFIPYISYNYNSLKIEPVITYSTLDMYVLTKESGKSLFTEPYYYEIQGDEVLISTVSIPMFNDFDEYIGVIGIDFEVEFIYDFIEENFNPTFNKRDLISTGLGTIIVNSNNPNDTMEHISKYHPLYETGFTKIDEFGMIEDFMPSGNYEIGVLIELGETEEHWYMLSDVDAALLFSETNQISNIMLYIGLLAIIITFIIMYFLLRSILKPLDLFTNLVGSFDPKDIKDFRIDIDSKSLAEIDILASTYKSTITKMQEDNFIKANKSIIQNAEISLRNVLQSSDSLDKISNNIIIEIASKVDAEVAALYIHDSINEKEKYILHGKYGLSKDTKLEYAFDEGLIGQTAIGKEIKLFKDLEITELAVTFGVGKSSPKNILILPCILNEKVVAVIELGKLNDFSNNDLVYLNTISFSVATAIEKVNANDKTKELLIKTQELATLLESQQEELRVSNEELESQQEELRVANEEQQVNIAQLDDFNKNLQLAQSEIEKRNIEIRNASKYKSEFLANMSHELRTPLNSILILSELLTENKTLNVKDREFAETINSSGKDLLELINGILDLSKVESGKEEIVITNLDIENAIKNLEKTFNPIALKSKVRFIINYDKDIKDFRTDEKKIKHIISNLLSNAFKFTKKGQVSLDIFKERNDIFFRVTDSGIGILPENIETIFGAFQQGDGTISREFGGTGLGLSISNKYSKLLGGRLVVESEPLKGSIFTLILPIVNIAKNDIGNSKMESKISKKSRNTDFKSGNEDIWFVADDRYNINKGDTLFLVIDDDSAFVSSIIQLIKSKGHKAIVTETGENGLFLADYYLPSGIILDISLPKMDGYEIIEKLKSNQRTRGIPVYLISGKDVEANKLKGGIQFFKKPINKSHIEKMILISTENTDFNSRLLIVEDDTNQRNSIIRYINETNNNLDLTIDSSCTGKETLELLKLHKYDLIILDLGLKDVEKFNLVEEIKQDNATSKIPMVIYTGKSFDSEEEEYLDNMVEDIIIKGEESHKRLVEDIQLFIHSHKSKVSNYEVNEFKGKTVLVIDDDMRNIFSISGILDMLDIKVLFDTNASSGIKRLKEDPSIDLVLMDIMMPEMDGFQAMEIIRKNKKFKKLPIIALTAKTMRGDRQKCITSGATEYLSKPLNKGKLISMLRVWL